MTSPLEDVAAQEAAERAEWGTYVAVEPIFIDGTRAFNPGHAVPRSHVEKFDLDDGRVERVDGTSPRRPYVQPVLVPEGDPITVEDLAAHLGIEVAGPDGSVDPDDEVTS